MQDTIRNFVIIAHVDHGKSTLADRLLEVTGTIEARQMKPQFLDQLELERERGITIKMAPVRMAYKGYTLNLIDTPGHSDFSYEVSRALEAVEGAILLVDATQGIQAQTLVNFRLAKQAGLTIIGAINKIDIAGLDPEVVHAIIKEMAGLLGVEESAIFKISGKTGEGVKELLDAVIANIPAPRGFLERASHGTDRPSAPAAEGDLRSRESASPAAKPSANSLRELPLDTLSKNSHEKKHFPQALIFDSLYDDHKGVIAFVRVKGGSFKNGDEVKFMATNGKFKIKEVGYFSPKLKPAEVLQEGETGYIATGVKSADFLRIGDTIGPLTGGEALPGYREPSPVVFVSLYPNEADEYEDVRQALLKLKLTDSSLTFEPDFNEVLGRGFKCGFLGQLHFEITSERLEREFELETVSTFPSVAYRVRMSSLVSPRIGRPSAPAAEGDLLHPSRSRSTGTGGSSAPAADDRLHSRESASPTAKPSADSLRELPYERDREEFITIENIEKLPDEVIEVQEPVIRVEIITPMRFLGSVLQLKDVFRIADIQTHNLENKILITAQMPLAALISDFDGSLKSVSEGMASFSYTLAGYAPADVAKVEIVIANDPVPGLTRLMYRDDMEVESRKMLFKLKDLLPRQQFVQALQARVGGRIIARENIPALKKDVTGYLYGGDRTRKMKLWKKQKEGKKKLKAMGRVTLSAGTFKELLKK